jgi:hypothetical protein
MRLPVVFRRSVLTGVLAALMAACGSGCAGAWPTLSPAAAVRSAERSGGGLEKWYDMDRDGRADYREVVSPAGRVDRIGYDRDQDGTVDEEIELAAVPPDQVHHLLIILDSVPVGLVREFQEQGRLLYFPRPTRVVSPFPVMTDPALVEFFGMAPAPSVEAEYYDGQRLRDGYEVYAAGDNTPWHSRTDYYLEPVAHAVAYLSQPQWFGHELRRVREIFFERDKSRRRLTVTYVVSTSALGSRQGRGGHELALDRLDRFCQQMVHDTRGRVRISLISDHGHALVPSDRIPLADELVRRGYRVGSRLERPGDVVVPQFGVVTCAALYTHEPACVAGDVVGIPGVDLAAWAEPPEKPDSVMVIDRFGRARITCSNGRFKYAVEKGDPLQLAGLLDELSKQGKLDADGFVADDVLFQATIGHTYPDAVARLWRAFHGLFVHVPDVLVSVQDGFVVGSKLMTTLVHMQGTHGNLRPASTFGFAASMAGELPPVLRMADLRAALQQAGVPLE